MLQSQVAQVASAVALLTSELLLLARCEFLRQLRYKFLVAYLLAVGLVISLSRLFLPEQLFAGQEIVVMLASLSVLMSLWARGPEVAPGAAESSAASRDDWFPVYVAGWIFLVVVTALNLSLELHLKTMHFRFLAVSHGCDGFVHRNYLSLVFGVALFSRGVRSATRRGGSWRDFSSSAPALVMIATSVLTTGLMVGNAVFAWLDSAELGRAAVPILVGAAN